MGMRRRSIFRTSFRSASAVQSATAVLGTSVIACTSPSWQRDFSDCAMFEKARGEGGYSGWKLHRRGELQLHYLPGTSPSPRYLYTSSP